MTRDELAGWLDSKKVVVLDVRPTPEYRAGHIPGARSVPVAELEATLDTLPRDSQVVAYCRGPYCVYADDAVRELHQRGYTAARLEDGYPEWVKAGLPTEP
jgi:rhodanese-related sulfurtransferase